MGICLRLVLFEVLRCVFVGLGGAGTSSLFSLSVGVVMLFVSSGILLHARFAYSFNEQPEGAIFG